MTTTRLRKKIHDYVDQVDHNFLEILDQLLNDHIKRAQPEIELTAADLEEIEKRKLALENGTDKGMTAEASVKALRTLLKKQRK